MPFATARDGTRLRYETFGDRRAEPLLLIQGLGADARGWLLQRWALRRYRCIAFDNRGVGGSDRPEGPYDLTVMAEDAVAVLDAAGVGAAHVMGASMGGVIAQLLAVWHPERVRSLVLACTACHHHQWRRDLLEDWARTARERGMGPLAARSLRWLVGPRSRRRLQFPAQVLGSLVFATTPDAFASQVAAILAADDRLRGELIGLDVPTLVVVGSQDILTPVADAEELAELILGAELAVVPRAGHGVMAEQPRAFNRAVLEFLGRQVGMPSTSEEPTAASA